MTERSNETAGPESIRWDLVDSYLADSDMDSPAMRVETQRYVAMHQPARRLVEWIRSGHVLSEATPIKQATAFTELTKRLDMRIADRGDAPSLRSITSQLPQRLNGMRALISQPLRKVALSAVVGAVPVALGIAFATGWRGEMAWHPRAIQTQAATTLYTTGPGEQRAFGLPDGSTVALWESSRLEVPRDFRTGGHPLRLQGAAAFTVRHQASGAFTVAVPGVVVRVLGTTFAVSRYAADTAATIAVRDGKVAVRADGREAVVLPAARLMVIGQRTMRMASFNGEQQYLQYLERGSMNPVIMMYSLIAMVDATPTVPVLTQPVSVASTAADSIAPPLMTDDLLLRWHFALIQFGDSLIVHPELQKIPELKPLLRHPYVFCGTWVGFSSNASPDRNVVDSLFRDLSAAKKATFGQQAGLPDFPIEDIAKAIAQKPALVGALSKAKLTPREFVAATSALEQLQCASKAFFIQGPDGPLYPGIDSTSTLGKNFKYFNRGGGNGYSRGQRLNNLKFDNYLWGIKDKDRNEMLGKGLDPSLGYGELLNPDGTEKPL